MKRIKAFYHIYKNSLYNVKYYKDVLKVDIKFSFKYFFTLALLATFITTTRIAVPLIPKVQVALDNMIFELSELYPRDLVITAENGEWRINKMEPYTIPTPEFFETEDAQFPSNLIVFDHQGTINNLKELDTLVLVNDVNIITINPQNKIEAYPLDNIPDGEVTREKIDTALDNISQYLEFVPFLIIFFVLIATFFYFAFFRLVYLVLVALILWSIGHINKVAVGLEKYYQISVHTLTLPLTIELLFTLVGFNLGMPFWFFGINLIYGIAVVYHLSEKKVTKSAKK